MPCTSYSRTITITEAKRSLGRYLKQAAAGEDIGIVTGAGGVRVAGIYKRFSSQPVLQGIDLDVPAGSFTAILGPSGSGKTTLLRLIAVFDRVDSGTGTVGGQPGFTHWGSQAQRLHGGRPGG